jgi:branched-chain amino acid transport system substrate-binding protein
MKSSLVVAVLASLPAFAAPASAQPAPLKLGMILDMSSVYADITGIGSQTAAQMAVEDFGGTVLGRPIEIVAADHQNKPDIASATAQAWFDNDHVVALMDVAASATALAAVNVGKAKNKIVILNAPGSSGLTNEACTPSSVHYTFDTYSMAHVIGGATVKNGGDSWFFLTADYAFGYALEKDTAAVVKAAGGTVLGDVKAPLGTADFSSFLLQAQTSKAKVIGLANAGGDFINSVKQASEFGIVQGGQNLAGLLVFINDINSLGLQSTQGMLLAAAFYWDMNDETRAWSKRFFERMHRMPNMAQAGVYSSTMHYLEAVKAAGTDATEPVMKAMRDMPINDFFAKNGTIRADGRMVHDMYLFQVKKPSESKGPWDYYKLMATIPGDQAFQPLSESRCPLVKK